MGVKAGYIEKLRAVPEGIEKFLNTAIPILETITKPTTESEAVIAQGVLAYNLNLILKAFEGLTLIELYLRIGQHSNVQEAMLLSIQEYIADSGGDNKIKVQHPENDGLYLPGDLQIIVKAVNGIPSIVEAVIGNTSINLDGQEGFWVGTVTLETTGEYTLHISAEYDAGDSATADVNFSIAEEAPPENPEQIPEPAEGNDPAAIQKAKEIAVQAYEAFLKTAVGSVNFDKAIASTAFDTWQDAVVVYYTMVKSLSSAVASSIADDIVSITELTSSMASAIESESKDAVTTVAGALQSAVDYISSKI